MDIHGGQQPDATRPAMDIHRFAMTRGFAPHPRGGFAFVGKISDLRAESRHGYVSARAPSRTPTTSSRRARRFTRCDSCRSGVVRSAINVSPSRVQVTGRYS